MSKGFVRHVRGKARHSYKWCAFNESRTPETAASTTTAELQILCKALTNANVQGDVTIERGIFHLNTRRISTGNLQAAVFGVAIQEVDATTQVPLQVINYLDVSVPEFTLGNKNILGYWPIQVPPIIGVSGAEIIDKKVFVQTVEFSGRKRLERMHQSVVGTLISDASAVVQVFLMSRLLLRYPS